MDALKRAAREVETDLKHTVRAADGTDMKDQVANAGDEVRKNLGNVGDTSAVLAGAHGSVRSTPARGAEARATVPDIETPAEPPAPQLNGRSR